VTRNFLQVGCRPVVLISGAQEIDMTDFARLLHADGPNPEHAAALQLYGRFVGDWDAEITAHGADGTKHTAPGEIHFGWVLEGRAIQDVWITPTRDQRKAPIAAAANFYGSTFRIYDPGIDAWHIFWIDPVKQFYSRMIGRADGNDIEQLTTVRAVREVIARHGAG
jgi:hypothetical protein